MITQRRLKDVMIYNHATGTFIWKITLSNAAVAGSICGSLSNRYREIKVDGIRYKAHRLVFLLMTGRWPSGDVDHINGNPLDNRWNNLRVCNPSQNGGNSRKPKNNTSGYKGVVWSKKKQKYVAQIKVQRRGLFLGHFDDPREAHETYCTAARKYFGEFARVA